MESKRHVWLEAMHRLLLCRATPIYYQLPMRTSTSTSTCMKAPARMCHCKGWSHYAPWPIIHYALCMDGYGDAGVRATCGRGLSSMVPAHKLKRICPRVENVCDGVVSNLHKRSGGGRALHGVLGKHVQCTMLI